MDTLSLAAFKTIVDKVDNFTSTANIVAFILNSGPAFITSNLLISGYTIHSTDIALPNGQFLRLRRVQKRDADEQNLYEAFIYNPDGNEIYNGSSSDLATLLWCSVIEPFLDDEL